LVRHHPHQDDFVAMSRHTDGRMPADGGSWTGGAVELAVLDTVPLFRLGIVAALGGGSQFSAPSELMDWLARDRACVVIVALDDADDERWGTLADLSGSALFRPVAVLADFSETAAGRALRAGAVHVLPRNVEPEPLRQAVDEAARGVVSIPVAVLRAATALHRAGRAGPSPTDEELAWLGALSKGRTVTEVAEDAHISERVLYRRLTQLYRKLGVDNRTQALILGRDEGVAVNWLVRVPRPRASANVVVGRATGVRRCWWRR
jgi:DNA-binding NarL/FixJ family response regulator